MLSYLSVSKDTPWIMTGMYSTSGALTHCLNSQVVITLSAASLQSPTVDAFLSLAGWWPCCSDIWQSRHSSDYIYLTACASFSEWVTWVQTWKWIRNKSGFHGQIEILREKNTHTYTHTHIHIHTHQLEEGWSPTQVTQPRHNLQVSFHRCYTDWSTVKVSHTRMRWHGQRCMFSLHMTPGQSGQKRRHKWEPTRRKTARKNVLQNNVH